MLSYFLLITIVSVFGTHVRILTPCVIIRTPYIPLDKLYSIDESIRQIKITLFIINFMNNLFFFNWLIIYLFVLFF